MINKKASSLLVLLIILCLQAQSNYTLTSYSQFKSSTPQTFGLHLVASVNPTIKKPKASDVIPSLEKSINYYLNLNCSMITEIVVVVSKGMNIKKTVFASADKWKQVNLFFQESDNANFYVPHPLSKSSLYFIMNSDAIISCQQLTRSYKIWVENSVGDVSPIVTYNPASHNFYARSAQFKFDSLKDEAKRANNASKYFSMAMLNGAWVSRFYLELFNTQKIQEIKKIRSLANKNNSCFDIGLNFIVYKYFPELNSIAIKGQFQFGKNYDAEEKFYTAIRSSCLRNMTYLLGMNPLRYINKVDPINPNWTKNQLVPFFTYLRRKKLELMLSDQSALERQLSKLQQQVQALKKQIAQKTQQIQPETTSPEPSEGAQPPKSAVEVPVDYSAEFLKKKVKAVVQGILGAIILITFGLISYILIGYFSTPPEVQPGVKLSQEDHQIEHQNIKNAQTQKELTTVNSSQSNL